MRRAVVLLALVLALPAAARTFESAGFAADKGRPKRIALMPARADMVRTRLNEALPFVKETAILEDALRAETATLIGGLGYEVDADSLTPAKLNADAALKDLVTQVEIQLSDLVRVASGDPKDIRIGRYRLGDQAAPLRARTGADGLLWLESQSIIPSKGQRALASVLSALSGAYGVPTNRTTLVAILLDLRTGELSRVSAGMVGGAVLKEPGRVGARVVRAAFDDWPAAGVARRLTKKQQRALAAGDATLTDPESGEESEQDAVAAFERAAAASPPPEPEPAGPPAEDVPSREDFAPEGPGSAESALPPMEEPPASSPPASAAAPPPPAVERAPGPAVLLPTIAGVVGRRPEAGVAPPAPSRRPTVPPAKSAWDLPEAQRPAPTAHVVLQMLAGGPALQVRNATRDEVQVSVDLDTAVPLAAGASLRLEVEPGSHRLLVLDAAGVERARASVLVGAKALANVEVQP